MDVRIIFRDQTEITAEQNGDCFIVSSAPEFPDDLSSVEIVSGEDRRVLLQARVIPCDSVDGRFWFAFAEESAEEKALRELREQNEMLTECLLEISEIVYGGGDE